MTLQEQYEWADNLQNEFLDLHNKFKDFPKYDGHYEQLANDLEEVIQTVYHAWLQER